MALTENLGPVPVTGADFTAPPVPVWRGCVGRRRRLWPSGAARFCSEHSLRSRSAAQILHVGTEPVAPLA